MFRILVQNQFKPCLHKSLAVFFVSYDTLFLQYFSQLDDLCCWQKPLQNQLIFEFSSLINSLYKLQIYIKITNKVLNGCNYYTSRNLLNSFINFFGSFTINLQSWQVLATSRKYLHSLRCPAVYLYLLFPRKRYRPNWLPHRLTTLT